MANYVTPQGDNPFWVEYPWVLVIRHVRYVGGNTNETVAEDPNALVRHIRRIANHRANPRRIASRRTLNRNVPFNETLKEPW